MYIVIDIAGVRHELKIELYYFSANIFFNSIYIKSNMDISVNSLYRVGIFTLGSRNKREGVSYKSNQSMTRPGYPIKMKFMITSQDMKSMNGNVLGSADNP